MLVALKVVLPPPVDNTHIELVDLPVSEEDSDARIESSVLNYAKNYGWAKDEEECEVSYALLNWRRI